MVNAKYVHEKDNVAVLVESITKGEKVNILMPAGDVKTITAADDILIYHKVAIRKIPKGAPIKKYGENIGQAAQDIEVGMHVHEHNVNSVREEL